MRAGNSASVSRKHEMVLANMNSQLTSVSATTHVNLPKYLVLNGADPVAEARATYYSIYMSYETMYKEHCVANMVLKFKVCHIHPRFESMWCVFFYILLPKLFFLLLFYLLF
uniref:Uncharacterized protein n=1 Tax=Brassica oleracea var. oleracea TaxID=109376 RepID=A0A0D3AQW0_BRAOL